MLLFNDFHSNTLPFPYSHLTIGELVNRAEDSDDPLVKALAMALVRAEEEVENVREEVRDAERSGPI